VRVALAITRREDLAVEAVQEAFLRAIRGRRRFRASGSLEAWVWRSVVNEAKRLMARPSPEHAVPEEASANGAGDDDAALRSLIGALPERQRLAVFLRYYADLDYHTIGEVLQIKTGTVSATLNAAHRSLREAIQGVRS
jgi:RNA polymerase sigma-70 factor (ECF subfamily)